MDTCRRRIVTASTENKAAQVENFDPFHSGTKRLKAGYKRLGDGVIQEVATGKTQKF